MKVLPLKPAPRNEADWVVRTYSMLACAFPDGLPETEYDALLAVLYPDMSNRTLAEAIVRTFAGTVWGLVYNDVLRIGSGAVPPSAVVEAIRKRLCACGYEAWLIEA